MKPLIFDWLEQVYNLAEKELSLILWSFLILDPKSSPTWDGTMLASPGMCRGFAATNHFARLLDIVVWRDFFFLTHAPLWLIHPLTLFQRKFLIELSLIPRCFQFWIQSIAQHQMAPHWLHLGYIDGLQLQISLPYFSITMGFHLGKCLNCPIHFTMT